MAFVKIVLLLVLGAAILSGCATGTSTNQSVAPAGSGYIDVGAVKKF